MTERAGRQRKAEKTDARKIRTHIRMRETGTGRLFHRYFRGRGGTDRNNFEEMSVIDKKKWLLFPVSVCLMAAGWSSGILSSDTGCSYKAFHYEAAEVYAKNAEDTAESGDNTSVAEEIDTAEASNVETQRVPVELVLQNPALPNGCESQALP